MHTPHTHTCSCRDNGLVPTHMRVCMLNVHTPRHAHSRSLVFATRVHTQLIDAPPHTRPARRAARPVRAHAQGTRHHPPALRRPAQALMWLPTHTASWERVRGAQSRADRGSISPASPPGPVFVQLFPLPHHPVQGGGRKRSGGDGAGHSGPNQEFHTPKGTGPLGNPPPAPHHPAGGRPKAGFVHSLPGTTGAPLRTVPHPLSRAEGCAPDSLWRAFCAGFCWPPLGAPPKASRHHMGLKEPSVALSQALSVGGWEGRWAQTLRPPPAGLPVRRSTCDFQI